MGLLPLEFSDCLIDSPYFRENLKAHEKQLDRTSSRIKGISRDIGDVIESSRSLSRAKRVLADSLDQFQFDILGTSLTDDEVIISNSLKEFARYLSQVEDEMERMLENAHEKFVTPLEAFRKDQIGSVKKTKKDFERATAKLCAAQDRHANTSAKRGARAEEALADAASHARAEKKNLNASSLEYVSLMHAVQERMKFEFVESIMAFMHTWANYYRHGQSVTSDYSGYMEDLKSRVQKTRENHSATVEQYEALKDKMLTGNEDPGLMNKMYTRQGYLYAQNGRNGSMKALGGSGWTKYYCQYVAKTKTLTMIPYNQTTGKITSTETIRVGECAFKEKEDAGNKSTTTTTANAGGADKFKFVVTGEDMGEGVAGGTPVRATIHTFQAPSDQKRRHWVEAMGGSCPPQSAHPNSLLRTKADSVEENLNDASLAFVRLCMAELEARGLQEQGLYRVGGVLSKVHRLMAAGLSDLDLLDLGDPKQWESKTIASAVKKCFADLRRPLLTHQLYAPFLEAAKMECETERLEAVSGVLRRLPAGSKEILRALMFHLSKVAAHSDRNLMTAGNLSVCFGPTLLRPKEQTVATIMDIKFGNEIVEILIDNCDHFFSSTDETDAPSADGGAGAASIRTGVESLAMTTKKMSSPTISETSSNSTERSRRGGSTPKQQRRDAAAISAAFSHYSTNSLPDIKDFGSNRHHLQQPQRQHQQQRAAVGPVVPGAIRQQPPSNLRVSTEAIGGGPNQISYLAGRGSIPLTTKPLASQQDDLMASLEMMNSLAADLPYQPGPPLRRSVTTGQVRRTSHDNGEVARKPPLPKLSLSSLSGASSAPPHPLQPHHRLNSSPSPCSTASSSSSSSSPRLLREGDVIDPLGKAAAAAAAAAPPPPARKYKRIVVSPGAMQDHAAKIADQRTAKAANGSTDSGLILMSSPSPKSFARRQMSGSYRESAGENSDPLSSAALALAGSLPPPPPLQKCCSDGCDVLSVASSAISFCSDDDALNKSPAAAKRSANGDEGDDEAEEDESVCTAAMPPTMATPRGSGGEIRRNSSSNSENVALGSSEDDDDGGGSADDGEKTKAETKKHTYRTDAYFDCRPEAERGPKLGNGHPRDAGDQERERQLRRQRRNRDSNYENVVVATSEEDDGDDGGEEVEPLIY